MDGCRMRADAAQAGDQGEEEGACSPKMINEVICGDDEDVVEDLVEADAWVLHEDRS